MAAILKSSFASPTADAKYPAVFPSSDDGFLSRVYSGMSAWSIVLTLFLMLVTYDQRKSWGAGIFREPLRRQALIYLCNSELHMAKRIDSGTSIEDSFHRSFSGVRLPEDGLVQGKVGNRRIKLCFRLPQVRQARYQAFQMFSRVLADILRITDSSSLHHRETWPAKSSTLPPSSNPAW